MRPPPWAQSPLRTVQHMLPTHGWHRVRSPRLAAVCWAGPSPVCSLCHSGKPSLASPALCRPLHSPLPGTFHHSSSLPAAHCASHASRPACEGFEGHTAFYCPAAHPSQAPNRTPPWGSSHSTPTLASAQLRVSVGLTLRATLHLYCPTRTMVQVAKCLLNLTSAN